ncbi:uncharacterized protein C8Q71DRAFT_863376 [Rhodofomes roseus]|uniref:Fatty acid synthase meander beta sheet domain-containing protein n=1 Tax=Rhodofomes roseus TaxID=34475 RepID=A0ABQ8JYF2_9APHY|nr:uncharacterized protein C8Q71DRAFT_863376 [Rhodofomes roseus]KAH9829304.1 hypothetical protein C8Q71DRAFT_863376 [Rhodofomes roseus]
MLAQRGRSKETTKRKEEEDEGYLRKEKTETGRGNKEDERECSNIAAADVTLDPGGVERHEPVPTTSAPRDSAQRLALDHHGALDHDLSTGNRYERPPGDPDARAVPKDVRARLHPWLAELHSVQLVARDLISGTRPFYPSSAAPRPRSNSLSLGSRGSSLDSGTPGLNLCGTGDTQTGLAAQNTGDGNTPARGVGPMTARNLNGCGVCVIVAGDKAKGIAELYDAQTVKDEEWLETLAGPSQHWLRALLTSTTIVQGTLYTDNPMRRLFAPRRGQQGDAPTLVALYGGARSYGQHEPDFKAVEIKFDQASQFPYKPRNMGYAPIHEVAEGRNKCIKDFYWRLWFGDSEVLLEINIRKTFAGPEVTIETFCAAVGNEGETFKTVETERIQAPMDFAIVTGWQVRQSHSV